MEDALPDLPRIVPDVVLVDIGLPGMSGIEGTRRMRHDLPQTQVLVLSVYDDDERVFEAMCAGACGYLLKKTPPAKLLESIAEVVSGGAPMSPEIARRVISVFQQFRPPRNASHELTPHELRLLKMLVEGHNYRTAAAELHVTVHAISFHMRKIYDKLQVHSKSEAVARALRDGILQ
jgi:DNA-binding NarL/FixJ family response regulator